MNICVDQYEAHDIAWEQARYRCLCGWYGEEPEIAHPVEQTAVDDYRTDYDRWIQVCPECEEIIEMDPALKDEMQTALAEKEPLEVWGVARPHYEDGRPCWHPCSCREEAEAQAALDNIKYPNIGPHRVVHLREVEE